MCDLTSIKKWIKVLGLLHDIGKYSSKFQEYIRCEDEKEQKRMRGKIPHAAAGAKEVVKKYKDDIGKVLAYAIAGHHSGLPNGKKKDEFDRASLEWKLSTKNSRIGDYSAYKYEISKTEIPKLFNKDIQWLIRKGDNKRTAFAISFFIRMLFSFLVDADRLNAAKFDNEKMFKIRSEYPSLKQIKENLDEYIEKISKKDPGRPINRKRREVLIKCLDAAKLAPGLFSLTVPTGGGKTLSSLSFALKHAIKHGMKRVIYVIPFTSIIEQNADVFRSALGDLKYSVIEHHSNFDKKKLTTEESEKHDLATENWDAPIIVTTNVQFFESLFSHRPSQCRKIHNIMNSVVILDEAQLLPVELLQPCMEVIRELTQYYKTSAVLCTATQPALGYRKEFEFGLKNIREIIEDSQGLYECDELKRVNIIKLEDELSDEELANKIIEHRQVLCVVNTRRHARELFKGIKDKDVSGAHHLSALMCPEHRSKVIKKIKEKLVNREKCRVISTQLIEAGVDIDFPVVYRAIAGIDSIAQAAGRCNRENKLAPEKGKVYIFKTKEKPPGYLRQSADKGEEISRHYENILSLDAVKKYFEMYYWNQKETENKGLDKKGILEKTSKRLMELNFPFREISKKFHLIEEQGYFPVIIQFDKECREFVEYLRNPYFSDWQLLRKLQRYTVTIPKRDYLNLYSAGVLEVYLERYSVLINTEIYDKDIGLCIKDPTYRSPESNIF